MPLRLRQEVQALPRAPGLIRGILSAALLLLAAPAQADCNPQLGVTVNADATLSLLLDAPCHPYRTVRIGYANLTLVEETSDTGRIEMRLPHVTGATSLDAAFDDVRLTMGVPAASDQAGRLVGVDWPDGDRLGRLGAASAESGLDAHYLVGFLPGSGAAHLELLHLPAGGDAYLELDVDARTCGRPISADVARDGGTPERLRVIMPECGSDIARLRLPL